MSDRMLFSTYQLGRVTLNNRLVMAPMTRSRSIGNVPATLVATYYGQRSDAGLIVTEGTSPSPNGLGYARIPGIFSAEQVAGWKTVTDAVHAKNGRIFVQLMHTGRVGHPLNLPVGAQVVAPSAIAAEGTMYTDEQGPQPHPVPHALTDAEVESTIEEYVNAAANAVEAGFDGIELHGANGYLIEQFLNVASNERTDRWGGSYENRARFAVEVVRRTAARIGPDRVGIRLSPYGVFGGMRADAETDALFVHLAKELSKIGIAYIHLVDHSSMGAPRPSPELFAAIRQTFHGTLVLSGGYDAQRAEHDLREGYGDLVAFGRPYISNPNLATKLEQGLPLAQPDYSTFYTPGEKGYTDYP